ncbi:MAG: hypothetical protein HC834_07665 [Rhodospirillales bacterium]|nr:hypothetical protein [Rhodospirillales bacterium]
MSLNEPPVAIARRLYRDIVRQARLPLFYNGFSVPDTPDGRFDMIALHAALVLRRLRSESTVPPAVSQALFDVMFAEFDESLREMGVGDLRVGKMVKGMAKGFYGRLAAYGRSLDEKDQQAMTAALLRNVYRRTTVDDALVASLAGYVLAQAEHLDHSTTASLLTKGPQFCPPIEPGVATCPPFPSCRAG